MYRTRLCGEIVAEFWPPEQKQKHKHDRVILLCDGMPSMPRKQPLAQFLAGKGYWVFYPRWRGTWESGGEFLRLPPQQDFSDVLDALTGEVCEVTFGRRFRIHPREVYILGGSFGGTAAILASLDPRVSGVVASCPAVDWKILDREQSKETSNPSYPDYIRQAWGEAYRMPARNWNKLRDGRFFSPVHEAARLDPAKILIYHAKDDPYIPWRGVAAFAQQVGIRIQLLQRGGHLGIARLVPAKWPVIERFFQRRSRTVI